MTTQYSIPIARYGANGFYPSRFKNQASLGITFNFDTPIPAGVIPNKKRQPRPTQPNRQPNKQALRSALALGGLV